jgi:hypothetical protein
MEIVQWVASNYVSLLEILAMVIGVASVIVRLTPTLKDDAILLPIVKFLGKYVALNVNISKEDRPK